MRAVPLSYNFVLRYSFRLVTKGKFRLYNKNELTSKSGSSSTLSERSALAEGVIGGGGGADRTGMRLVTGGGGGGRGLLGGSKKVERPTFSPPSPSISAPTFAYCAGLVGI